VSEHSVTGLGPIILSSTTCVPNIVALARSNVADPHHLDAHPDTYTACHFHTDPDPYPACHFNVDPDPYPACQFDVDPDPTFHFNADTDSTFQFDADPCRS
jgi:hypothetical protein